MVGISTSGKSRGEPAWDRPYAPRELPDWLIAHGRHWVTVADVAELLELPPNQVPPIAARLRAQGRFFSPTRGAYVPVPPEYRSWRTVPASHFIDPLMRHLGHPYYVGLLSAAELHGVAQQHPQIFQVVTSARLRARSYGRVRIEFINSARTAERTADVMNTPTGTVRVSSRIVTVLDLVNWPGRSGGLSNVATVLGEMLAEGWTAGEDLALTALTYPLAVAQRAGWLLDHVAALSGVEVDLEPLAQLAHGRAEPTALSAGGRRAGVRDQRWNVLVNVEVEPDL